MLMEWTDNLALQAGKARLEAYLKHRRGMAASTLQTYLKTFERLAHAVLAGGVYPLEPDAGPKVKAYLDRMTAEGLSPFTVRNYATVFRYYAEAVGQPEACEGVSYPVTEKASITRALTELEIEALARAIKRQSAVTHKLFMILVLTGLRLSELLALDATALEVETQRLVVKAPSGKKRAVFIGEKAKKLLLSFYSPRRRMPRGNKVRVQFTRHLGAAAEACGLEHVTTSQLRATYAVRMITAGHDYAFVAKNLGLDEHSRESQRRLRNIVTAYMARTRMNPDGQA